MIRLAVTLTRASGWPRMFLLASCTAVVCALLLVVVTFARLPANPDEILFNTVAEPGLRGGTALATALLALPPLLLLYQAVRLGTAARERRLAALRLAGATPSEVRRLGALEVGIPALVGSLAGIALFWLMRVVLGGDDNFIVTESYGDQVATSLRLVPTSVSPTWWDAALIVLGTTLAGVFVGARASRRVIVTPLGVSRRQRSAPPRPWGLLLILGALVVAPALFGTYSAAAPLAVVLGVLGLMSLASWTAYRVGTYVESRARSAPVLLAARRLVTDPRPAGRAAAAVGAIALISGGGGAMFADLVAADNDDPFYSISLALVAGALLVALAVVIGTLAVHSVESLLDHKRPVASLAALGMSLSELESSQRWEARLVALPMAAVGVLLGAGFLGVVAGNASSPWSALILLADIVGTLGLVWLAISVAVRLTRPWAVRAASPANLRTE